MSNKGKKKKKRKVHDQIQPSSDKTTSSVFGRSDIHSILSNTGEYSDTSSDDDVQSQSSTSVSDDDECVSPSPEHSDGDGDNGDGDFLPAKDKHSNKRKKVLPQCDINSKKSKVNSSEVIIENTSIATASHHDGSKKSNVDSAGGSLENENMNTVRNVVYLRGQSVKLTSCNPLTICRDIEKAFGPVQRVQRRGESLKLTCTSVKQKDSVLACTLLGSIDVLASLPNVEARKIKEAQQQRIQRVVISGVSTEIDDISIQESTGATEVRRIVKRDLSRNKVLTKAVVLGYSCNVDEVPARVHLGYLTFKTRVYIPKVTRCFKCQRYGHIAAHCRKEEDICPVCAGPHKYSNCSNMDNKKCANCGDAHSASYQECPKFLAAKQLTYHAAVNRLSYRDALIQIRKKERA